MQFYDFIIKLAEHLKKPLPGKDAHSQMVSETRFRTKIAPDHTTRKSAVLILFYPYQKDIFLPLILRPAYDGVHGGQMAFPGGRQEKDDESLIRTALREAQEEIGVKAIDVKIIGQLTEIFIPPSNFWVQPVIGYIPYRPDFFPDPREVETVVEVRLKEFLEEGVKTQKWVETRGYQFETPGYAVLNQWIWGATALMIAELLAVIQEFHTKEDK